MCVAGINDDEAAATCKKAARGSRRVNAGLQNSGGYRRHRSCTIGYGCGNDPAAIETAAEGACGPQHVGQFLSARVVTLREMTIFFGSDARLVR
jgi:hypothetical protein